MYMTFPLFIKILFLEFEPLTKHSTSERDHFDHRHKHDSKVVGYQVVISKYIPFKNDGLSEFVVGFIHFLYAYLSIGVVWIFLKQVLLLNCWNESFKMALAIFFGRESSF